MKKNITILTKDLYVDFNGMILKEEVSLKEQQDDAIKKILAQKELLISLKNEIKGLKESRRMARKNLKLYNKTLSGIKWKLDIRNSLKFKLGSLFSAKKEKNINLDKINKKLKRK